SIAQRAVTPHPVMARDASVSKPRVNLSERNSIPSNPDAIQRVAAPNAKGSVSPVTALAPRRPHAASVQTARSAVQGSKVAPRPTKAQRGDFAYSEDCCKSITRDEYTRATLRPDGDKKAANEDKSDVQASMYLTFKLPEARQPQPHFYEVSILGKGCQEKVLEQGDKIAETVGRLLELVHTKYPNFSSVTFQGGNGRSTFASAKVVLPGDPPKSVILGGTPQAKVEDDFHVYTSTYADEFQKNLKVLRLLLDDETRFVVQRHSHRS
ncbi:MAG TPA: hypothetical protein VFH51_10075, partial [Myxococcota bacterium]|nr:hypothetical protein [Myxococcota bacterium]